MTKKQYTDWILSAEHLITDYNEYDSDGNHYARDIFRKDGIFYSVEYGNGELIPCMRKDDSGKWIITNDYELKEIPSAEVNQSLVSPPRKKYVADEVT